jgi:alpha-tubulin suppressor-like RCC1 family protein
MRGCSNFIVFSRTDATPIDQPVPIILNITGTATMGVDYSDIPIRITEFENIIAIGCGSNHSLVITKEGVIRAWGGNGNGQLGVGNTKSGL